MSDVACIDWQGFDAAAFERARQERKPLLLRITHFGCEGAENMRTGADADPVVQRALADQFVCTQVDRDADPALDRLCQLAHQLLTQTPGGWPLHVFFDAEAMLPYFSATWLPAKTQGARPAFATLLARVRAFHDAERDALNKQHAALRAALDELSPPTAQHTEFDATPLRKARAALDAAFDTEHGGFKAIPKFVRPPLLERLLRDWRASARGTDPDLQALFMVSLTLTRLAASPMRAQNGAFYHHAGQADWSSPDTTLTLADNGALLALYAQVALATGEREFLNVTLELATALLRDWRTPDGAFVAAIRTTPAVRDETVHVASNAHAIRGLAWAARLLRDERYVSAALATLNALRLRYWREDRLRHTDGRAMGLDEYATLADATLEVLQQHWDVELHAFLERLIATMRTQFEDVSQGGFFDVEIGAANPPSFYALKTLGDDGAPSGNALAARVLLRTAAFAGDPSRSAGARKTLALAWPMLGQQPQAHATMLGVLEETLVPPELLVLRGAGREIDTARLDLQKVYAPSRLVFAIPEND